MLQLLFFYSLVEILVFFEKSELWVAPFFINKGVTLMPWCEWAEGCFCEVGVRRWPHLSLASSEGERRGGPSAPGLHNWGLGGCPLNVLYPCGMCVCGVVCLSSIPPAFWWGAGDLHGGAGSRGADQRGLHHCENGMEVPGLGLGQWEPTGQARQHRMIGHPKSLSTWHSVSDKTCVCCFHLLFFHLCECLLF